eukprot:jgi/Picre1/34867/NNA_002333.t1
MAGENALRDLTVDGLQQAYSTGTTTPTQICLDLHKKICESENIFIDIPSVESVVRRCEEIESFPQEQRGVLYGVPFAVKDNIDVAGYPTTAACPSFSYQASRGAKVVEAVLREGAVYMGKVNLDQFACGLVGTRSPYGIPPNKYHRDWFRVVPLLDLLLRWRQDYAALLLELTRQGLEEFPQV